MPFPISPPAKARKGGEHPPNVLEYRPRVALVQVLVLRHVRLEARHRLGEVRKVAAVGEVPKQVHFNLLQAEEGRRELPHLVFDFRRKGGHVPFRLPLRVDFRLVAAPADAVGNHAFGVLAGVEVHHPAPVRLKRVLLLAHPACKALRP